MKIKTSELEGAALDWAVAKVVGDILPYAPPIGTHWSAWPLFNWKPSKNWLQCGPLIEKYIHLISQDGKGGMYAQCVSAPTYEFGEGPTILIAACRAIVASVLGDEVDVPGELAK